MVVAEKEVDRWSAFCLAGKEREIERGKREERARCKRA